MKRVSKPWLTPQLLNEIKLKSNMFKRYKLGIISELENKLVRNRVNVLVKNAKLKYHKTVFAECNDNLKQTWKNIRNLISSNKTKTSSPSLISGGNQITNPVEVARTFSSYFSNVAVNIDNSIPIVNQSPLSYVHPNIFSSLFLYPVSASECKNIILSLKNTKTDLNSISVKALKAVSDVVGGCFAKLINASMAGGLFPNVFKTAIIIPVFKKGDESCVENYRPISLLPTFSKIMEKCVARRLLDFLSQMSIITPSQFGFRSGFSTVDVMIEYSGFLYENLNSGKALHQCAG